MKKGEWEWEWESRGVAISTHFAANRKNFILNDRETQNQKPEPRTATTNLANSLGRLFHAVGHLLKEVTLQMWHVERSARRARRWGASI